MINDDDESVDDCPTIDAPPWRGEFVLDDPKEMDDMAIEILMRNMRDGRDG